ncbi:MAG: 2-dehydropantoate 2-reductase [Thermoplasmata archaeon]|nr:2-dehydropantoate 2-reductase [Thermoplasmata archaeon]
MRVVVFAAGAIGSLLGASLSHAGHTVLLVGRADHAEAIRTKGLRITGSLVETVELRAETSVPADFAPEVILLTAKTFDLPAAASLLGIEVPTPIPTLLPQNGLGVEEPVRTALSASGWPDPERWVVRAVNTLPATLLGPGEVRAAGQGELVFGRARAPAAGATRILTRLFRTTEIPVRAVDNLERAVWRKALINAAVNPVTALHGVSNGHLLEEPYRTESLALLREALATARAVGFDFPEKEVHAELDRVLKATAENRSSMLQDIDRGRRTEIQAISGEILRQGTAQGLDLPATRRAVDAIRARSPGGALARGQSS